jgi:hypothetical protein
MILLVDVGRDSSRVGLLAKGDVRWFVEPGTNAFVPLQAALAAFGAHRLTHVACLRYPDAVPTTVRPSWSGVRSATTLANALAFAWGVPAGDVLAGGEADEAVVGAAVDAAHAHSAAGDRAHSEYDGLPNITAPKSG